MATCCGRQLLPRDVDQLFARIPRRSMQQPRDDLKQLFEAISPVPGRVPGRESERAGGAEDRACSRIVERASHSTRRGARMLARASIQFMASRRRFPSAFLTPRPVRQQRHGPNEFCTCTSHRSAGIAQGRGEARCVTEGSMPDAFLQAAIEEAHAGGPRGEFPWIVLVHDFEHRPGPQPQHTAGSARAARRDGRAREAGRLSERVYARASLHDSLPAHVYRAIALPHPPRDLGEEPHFLGEESCSPRGVRVDVVQDRRSSRMEQFIASSGLLNKTWR